MLNLTRRDVLGTMAVLGAALLAGPAALAQPAAPTRLRGTIASLDGDVLTVNTREGGRASVTLSEPLTVVALRRVQLSDITAGTSVGVVAEPGPEDTLKAVAITVLPPGVRINERQVAWDLAPNTSMNDGPVEAVVESGSGRELTLKIHGKSVKVRVSPETPLVSPVPASREDLVQGAAVFINAMAGADGKLTAGRVVVGKNGVAPPI